MNIYTVPYFNQNIVLNPYIQNTALPISGCLGYVSPGSNVTSNVAITSSYQALSNITLTSGVWLVMGYATFNIDNGTNACGTLSITDSTSTNVINNYTSSMTGQFPSFQQYFSLSITGVIYITSNTSYRLSALSTSASSSTITININTITFNATRIA